MSKHNDVFVTISRDAATIAALRAALGDRGRVLVARSLSSALIETAGMSVRGYVLDGRVVPAAALSQLDELRSVSPLADVLYVAAELTSDLLNLAQPMRVQVVALPLPEATLRAFVARALGSGRVATAMLHASIEHLRTQYSLSGNDLALVPMLLDAESETDLRHRLGVDADTLARSVKRLVRKCHMRNPERLANSVVRDALVFAQGRAGGDFAQAV